MMIRVVSALMSDLVADAGHEDRPSVLHTETLALMAVQPPSNVFVVSDEEKEARVPRLLSHQPPSIPEVVLHTMWYAGLAVLRDRYPAGS